MRRTLRLAFIVAIACSAATGCGDDDAAVDSGVPGPALRCRGDVLERREGQSWVTEQDCAEQGSVCGEGDGSVPACVAAPCRTGEKDCDGDVLIRCQDGSWEVEQDCASLGQFCVPLLGGLPLCSSERP